MQGVLNLELEYSIATIVARIEVSVRLAGGAGLLYSLLLCGV